MPLSAVYQLHTRLRRSSGSDGSRSGLPRASIITPSVLPPNRGLVGLDLGSGLIAANAYSGDGFGP